MEFKDYYQILGIDRDATQDEVKRSYRKAARKYHPDVSKEADAEERFKELGEAYEVLKDPEKRAAYDQLGANWQAGQEFRPPPDWDAGFEFSGGGFTDRSHSDFSEFFENLFGGAQGHRTRYTRHGFRGRGEDHHAKVMIDLEDAWQGATRAITLQVPEIDSYGRVQTHQRVLNVKIPKGVTQGQQIRLAGQGAPGMDGEPAGDLYLELHFRPHPLYRVEGRDLYMDLPVTPWEAALGARIQLPLPDGTVDMKIPAGSAAGKRLRLKGRGIPGSQPGDIYVVLQIALPPADTDEAVRLYREMADKLAFDPRARLGL